MSKRITQITFLIVALFAAWVAFGGRTSSKFTSKTIPYQGDDGIDAAQHFFGEDADSPGYMGSLDAYIASPTDIAGDLDHGSLSGLGDDDHVAYATTDELSTAEADISSNASSIDSLQSDVTTNTTNISSNASSIDTNQANISSNSSSIDDLQIARYASMTMDAESTSITVNTVDVFYDIKPFEALSHNTDYATASTTDGTLTINTGGVYLVGYYVYIDSGSTNTYLQAVNDGTPIPGCRVGDTTDPIVTTASSNAPVTAFCISTLSATDVLKVQVADDDSTGPLKAVDASFWVLYLGGS